MVSNLLIIHLGGECETNNNNSKFCEEKEEESDDMTDKRTNFRGFRNQQCSQ